MPTRPAIFKWRQTEPQLILCAVRWYLRYSLSLRDVEELLEERCLVSTARSKPTTFQVVILSERQSGSAFLPSGFLQATFIAARTYRLSAKFCADARCIEPETLIP